MDDKHVWIKLTPDDADALSAVLSDVNWQHHDYVLNAELLTICQAVVDEVQEQINRGIRTVDGGRYFVKRVAEAKEYQDALLARLRQDETALGKEAEFDELAEQVGRPG